jgi:hypothetical protein
MSDAAIDAMAKAMANESGYPPGGQHSPNLAYWRIMARAALTAYQQATAPSPTPEGATSAQTWWLKLPCVLTDGEPLDKPCQVQRITDEYGQGTPHLQCVVHGNDVGHVTEDRDA